MTGQDLITTSIISMENFLSNNVPFNDTNDVITFIQNIKDEKPKFSILDYVDEPIGKQELVEYLCNHVIEGHYIDVDIVSQYVSIMDPELVTRCYYKNQILELITKNSWFLRKLGKLIQFKYAEAPEPDMVDDLTEFRERILDFCFYDCLFEDRYKRSMKDFRKSIITIDTDSNFINLNRYIECVNNLFTLDKINKDQQLTVMNIFVDTVTESLKKTFWTLTTNMGLIDEAKPLINMKSEFNYQRIMLTRNKKSYAGIITAELGKQLSKPVLDMKGLSIRKTSVPKTLRKQFTSILENDVLKSENISLRNIIEKYDDTELLIENSLKNGNTEYVLPKNLELIESYKVPDTIEPVRAALIWNALEPEDQIIPPEKINILKLNCTEENDPRLLKLKENYPEKYNAIMKVVFNHNITTPKIDISRFGFSCVALPKSVEKIPDYLIPFIDIPSMVNTNMTNGFIILESLGIYTEEVKTVKYKSNIISI